MQLYRPETQFIGDADQIKDYIKETFKLKMGQVYVSKFDLNVEHEKVSEPRKPVIRFGTVVSDSNGQKKGVVVLNFLGKRLLDMLDDSRLKAAGNLVLLNSDGYWLHGGKPEEEWGFMYDDKKDFTFGFLIQD